MCRVEAATTTSVVDKTTMTTDKTHTAMSPEHPKPAANMVDIGEQNKSLVEAGVFLGVAVWVWSCYKSEPLIAESFQSDVIFSVAFSLYLFALNYIRFDNNRLARERGVRHTSLGKSHYLGSTAFALYMGSAVLLSVLAPTVLLCAWPRSPAATAAAPHLFVLLMQVVMENATGRPMFHDLPRILVPLGFSIWREFNLWTWTKMAWEQYQGNPNELQYTLGLTLAVVNLLFYSYNLFVFLIMGMTPHYLDPKECPSPEIQWAAWFWPQVVQRRGQEDEQRQKKE